MEEMIFVSRDEVEDGNLLPPQFGVNRLGRCHVHRNWEDWHWRLAQDYFVLSSTFTRRKNVFCAKFCHLRQVI